MLVLLPPSEGKAAPPRRGRPVDPADLPHPSLAPLRAELLDALVAASAEAGAAERLGLSPGLADEVARNVHLRTTPARPAAEVYTGVLYAALDHATLDAGARRRAHRTVRVQSALWGPVGLADRVAPYRLPMTASLPGLGPVAARWRGALGPVMAELAGDGVVVDGRSASYASVWRPGAAAARRYVAVRVFSEVAGRRTVVSHAAKHTRGLVARWLCQADRLPRTPAHVAAVVAEHRPCTLVPDGRGGWFLDVDAPAALSREMPRVEAEA